VARSLGLDVGNRRIGVAASDESRIVARPVEIIDRTRTDAIGRIAELARALQADEIVIGLPCGADGAPGEQARRVQRFSEALGRRVGLPQRFCDERHSTEDAREIINLRKRKRQGGPDDAVAAAVILQRYLDESSTFRSRSTSTSTST
jgi:putative Holliday junction resolvase